LLYVFFGVWFQLPILTTFFSGLKLKFHVSPKPLPTCKCSSPHGNANNKYYYMGILHHVMSFNFNHQRIVPLFFYRMNAYYTSQYCMTWNQNQNLVCGSERPQLYLIHHTLMSEKTKVVQFESTYNFTSSSYSPLFPSTKAFPWLNIFWKLNSEAIKYFQLHFDTIALRLVYNSI
jgi:hypothetical protein